MGIILYIGALPNNLHGFCAPGGTQMVVPALDFAVEVLKWSRTWPTESCCFLVVDVIRRPKRPLHCDLDLVRDPGLVCVMTHTKPWIAHTFLDGRVMVFWNVGERQRFPWSIVLAYRTSVCSGQFLPRKLVLFDHERV